MVERYSGLQNHLISFLFAMIAIIVAVLSSVLMDKGFFGVLFLLQGGALLGNVNALLTSFPADPVDQYRSQCRVVLEGLNLPSLLRSEMGRLSRWGRCFCCSLYSLLFCSVNLTVLVSHFFSTPI